MDIRNVGGTPGGTKTFLLGIIVAGIIANMDIHFRQTSLWNTLIMLVLLVGGIGLVARAVLPMGGGDRDRDRGDRD